MSDSRLARALGALVLLIIGLAAVVNLCSCSPVLVQVQNCQHEVRDSSGVTFTGCKIDGTQDADADGELRVNIPTKTPQDPGAGAGAQSPPPPRGRLSQVDLLN